MVNCNEELEFELVVFLLWQTSEDFLDAWYVSGWLKDSNSKSTWIATFTRFGWKHKSQGWLGCFPKLILVECGIIGSDVPCFKKVSKWLCIKYETSWKVKTECYRYECLSSKGPWRTYARDLGGEGVLVMLWSRC